MEPLILSSIDYGTAQLAILENTLILPKEATHMLNM